MTSDSPERPVDLNTTATLLSRIRAGDGEAREDLFRRFEGPLLRFLHGRLPATAAGVIDTCDAAQEVASKVFRSLDRFDHRGVGAFWAYLRAAATNYLRDLPKTPGKLRRAASLAEESHAEPMAQSRGPIERVVHAEDLAAFERALHVLDDRSRSALLMRFELQLDYAAIATEAEFASADAARMSVARAVERVGLEMARERRETH